MEPVENEPYKLGPLHIWNDNKGAVFSVNNPLTSAKSRCLATRRWRMREMIKEKFVYVSHIFTEQNVADFFTKPLEAGRFLKLRRFLMNE